ncbi:MAG: SDR family NAD(P)-dependent oxidoreductase [bacterium]|nr:SDR family NAD(P)-dependent oxidoreductase [bacterium]
MSAEPLKKYRPCAVVTGVARPEGIGYGYARRLADHGFNLILIDICADELHERADELRSAHGVEAKAVVCDLGDPDFLELLRPQTDDIDVGLLIANHYISPEGSPSVLEMDLADHHRMLDVNARAYTTLVHHYGGRMAERGCGGIILTSSAAALLGAPYMGPYSANKAYQRNLAEALWSEMRPLGVDVLVVLPGAVDSQPEGALDHYPKWLVMEVDDLVSRALGALGRKPVLIPGLANAAIGGIMVRLLPRAAALKLGARLSGGTRGARGDQ